MDGTDDGPLSNDQYQLGWICALPIELAASVAMLDQYHGPMDNDSSEDTNSYIAGRIQGHNIVMACLPDGEYGTNAAAVVATNMLRTFKNIKCGLLVGIGGGLPSDRIDIRLGDVVVSSAEGTSGGVIQYDLGKMTQTDGSGQGGDPGEQFIRKGTLDRPPSTLRSALSNSKAVDLAGRSQRSKILREALDNPNLDDIFRPPTSSNDHLFLPTYIHPDSSETGMDCSVCDLSQLVTRAFRPSNEPKVFYGTILSGNSVIKSTRERDRLRDLFKREKALCVEMEAAGLMNSFPCLVIRGICDYADSHKNDQWHGYAALTAAAFAKNLLIFVSKAKINEEKAIQVKDISELLKAHVDPINTRIEGGFERIHSENRQRKLEAQEADLTECHRQLHPGTSYEETKRIIADRASGTCKWILSDQKFVSWNENPLSDLLWISASPGCGKSVFCKSLVDEILTQDENLAVCYYFFRDSTGENTLSTALCSILFQLFDSQPQLRKHALVPYKRFGSNIRQEPNALWKILLSAASDPDASQIVCVIDALDEASAKWRGFLIQKLCRFFIDLSKAPTPQRRLKFLVTSRPYDGIQAGFELLSESLPKIRIKGEDKHEPLRQEINELVRIRVDEIAKKWKLSEASKDRLQSELLTMEHRTYLWLKFATDNINKTLKDSTNPDLASIERLPRSVDEAYTELLSKIDTDVEERARKILLLVTGARRALTIGELCLALETYEQTESESPIGRFNPLHLEQYMRQWCGLFILFDQGKVYLVHQTAKDFLLSHGQTSGLASNPWKNSMKRTTVEKVMALICARYLCSETSRQFTSETVEKAWNNLRNPIRTQKRHEPANTTSDFISLYIYAASFWTSHLVDSAVSQDDSVWTDVHDVYYQLTNPGGCPWAVVLWGKFSLLLDGCDKYPIFLAIAMGHFSLLRLQIASKGFELEHRDIRGRTPLIFAADRGLQASVQILVAFGASLNARSDNGEDALIHSVGAGHIDVVQLLLEQRSDPNSHGCSSHPLIRAATTGQIEMINVLLKHKSDVNARAGYFGSALQTSAYYGHLSVITRLLDAGACIDEETGAYGSALQAACVAGELSIVKALILHKANVNQEGGLYGSPLLAAFSASSPNRDIVDLLLHSGASANVALSRIVKTPVVSSPHFAPLINWLATAGRWTQSDRSDIIRWRKEAAVYKAIEVSNLTKTTSDVAEAEGNTERVSENSPAHASLDDASTAIRDEIRDKPVWVACYRMDLNWIKRHLNQNGLMSTYRYLRFESCEPWRNLHMSGRHSGLTTGETASSDRIVIRQKLVSRNPLVYACILNDVKLAKDLLAANCPINGDDDSNGWSPLHQACLETHEEMVHLLLERNANVNAQDKSKGSPLQLSCKQMRSRSLMSTLIAAGADVNACNPLCPPALHQACKDYNTNITEMLLEAGADVNLRHMNNSPLSIAIEKHDLKLIQLLLERGAKVASKDWNKSPLAAVDKYHDRKIHQALLRSMVETEHQDASIPELLSFAVEDNRALLIETMLQFGMDVNSTLPNGSSLLYAAVVKCRPEIVRILLPNGGDLSATFALQGGVVHVVIREITRQLERNGHRTCAMQRLLTTDEAIEQSLATREGTYNSSYNEILNLSVDAGATEKVEELFETACELNSGLLAQAILDGTWPSSTGVPFTQVQAMEIAWKREADFVVATMMARHSMLRRHHWIDKKALLDSAIRSSTANMVLAVLKNGCDANPEHSPEGPPLYQAALKGDINMVGLLVAAAAVVNIQTEFTGFENGSGRFYGTSLHAVARVGNFAAAKLLVAAGADMLVPGQCQTSHPLCKSLCTAIETAEHFGHSDLATWLKDVSTEYGGEEQNPARTELESIRGRVNGIRDRFRYLESMQSPESIKKAKNQQLLRIQRVATEDSGFEMDWNESGSECDF